MKQVQGRLDMVSSLWCKDTCSHFRSTCHCILTQSLTTAQNAAYNIFSAQHIYVIHYGSCSRKPPAFVSSIAYHYDEFRPAVILSNMADKKPHCPNFKCLSSPLGYRSATFPKGNAARKTCPKPGLQIQKGQI